jgi:hypothetical protein
VFGAKSVADTVTLEPGGPLVGDMVKFAAALALSNPTNIIPVERTKITNRETDFFKLFSD